MNDEKGKRIFNKASYDENDKKAKNYVRAYMDSIEVFTFIPKENYGVDLYSYNATTGVKRRHECEMKNQWVGDWPNSWDVVRIPGRKRKLLECGDNISFWVIRNDGKYAWRIEGHQLHNRIKSVSITPCPQGEDFFCIPYKECTLVKLGA